MARDDKAFDVLFADVARELRENGLNHIVEQIRRLVRLKGDPSLDEARSILRQDYLDDVNGVVEDIASQVHSGEIEDREGLFEAIREAVDGHSRVIHTAQAQEGLAATNNADVWMEDFGAPPEGDGMFWSRLMYAAMERDVIEALSNAGIDPNDDTEGPRDDDEEG